MAFSGHPLRLHNPNIPVYRSFEGVNVQPGKLISGQDKGSEVDDHIGHLQTSDLYLPNFSMRSTTGEFYTDAHLINDTGEGADLLGSCLFLKGLFRSFLPDHGHVVDSVHHSQNFKFDPDNEYIHALPKNDAFHLIHFSYTSDYFLQFLPEQEAWAEQLKEKILKKQRILGDQVTAISLHQERALQYVFDCPLTGKLGMTLMETAIVQIILLQLQALFKTETIVRSHTVHKRDLEAIHELRSYLGAQFLEDHSLQCLSRHFGMNSTKMMLLFKKTFGQSIFEYISDLRMQHARQLLDENELLVTQIARVVGYKNPNHFSTAFKKRFGVNPTELRFIPKVMMVK